MTDAVGTNFQYDSGLPYDADIPYDAFSPTQPTTPPTVLPHLAISLSLGGDGTFDYVLQGTVEEIAQSVTVVCDTTTGDRTVVPTFGIPLQTFDGPNKQQIITAINKWEPRAAATVTTVTNDDGTASVQVGVSVAGQGNANV